MHIKIGEKAISPMIATVLLIAFTVAVGGILSLWLTSLTSTQTTTTGTAAEKQILCARSVLSISEVTFLSSSSGDSSNVTVVYDYGTENLYNFTITFVDSDRKSATVNLTALSPQYTDAAGQRFTPGMMNTWRLNLTNVSSTGGYGGSLDILTGTTLQSVRVAALCQSNYPISAECKSGQSCMV